MAAAAGLAGMPPRELAAAFESGLFGQMSKLLAAAFRDDEVAAAARETIETAIRNVREDVAAAARDPRGSEGSNKNSSGGPEITPR
jgi:hypothetical protein